MRSSSFPLVLALVLLGAVPVASAQLSVPIHACGQAVPPRAQAYLTGDLDCSSLGYGVVPITLGKRATLDLGGFTFTTGATYGISCDDGRCTVRNGTVTGAAEFGGIVGTKMVVDEMTISLSGILGISLGENSVLRRSTVIGTATVGVHQSGSKKKVRILDSTISGHGGIGVWVYKADLVRSTVTGNGTNPACATDPDCADLMTAKRPKLKDSTCGRSQTLPNDPIPGCLGWCVCTDD